MARTNDIWLWFSTLRELYFHFLSHLMGYDRGDSFPFDFEPNGILFVSKSKGKLSPRSYPIQCERKWNTSFSVYRHINLARFSHCLFINQWATVAYDTTL